MVGGHRRLVRYVVFCNRANAMKHRESLSSAGRSGAFLTIPEVAERLAIGRATAYELISKRQLAHYRVGRSVRVREEDVLAFLETVRQEAALRVPAYVRHPAV